MTGQIISTHVINLDRDQERLAYMARTLSGFGIDFTRFRAVDGLHLSTEQAAYHNSPQRRHLGDGEVAALLSHIAVWLKVAEGSAAFGLIFEDDVHIAPDFSEFLSAAASQISSTRIELHRLETFLARVTMERTPRHTVGNRSAHALETNHGGTAAYVINRPTALHLLTFVDQFKHAIDIELFDPTRRTTAGIDILQWVPAPCLQDMKHDHALGFQSNVVAQRADARDGLTRKKGPADQIKNIFRPAYTALYSAALWPSGRWRAQVPFG